MTFLQMHFADSDLSRDLDMQESWTFAQRRTAQSEVLLQEQLELVVTCKSTNKSNTVEFPEISCSNTDVLICQLQRRSVFLHETEAKTTNWKHCNKDNTQLSNI